MSKYSVDNRDIDLCPLHYYYHGNHHRKALLLQMSSCSHNRLSLALHFDPINNTIYYRTAIDLSAFCQVVVVYGKVIRLRHYGYRTTFDTKQFPCQFIHTFT